MRTRFLSSPRLVLGGEGRCIGTWLESLEEEDIEGGTAVVDKFGDNVSEINILM